MNPAPISTAIGYSLSFLDKALKVVVAFWRCENDTDPALRHIRSRQAYERVQTDFRRQIDAVRAKHGRVREIERQRTATVHNALRGVR